MKEIKKIFVPVDLDKNTDQIAGYAAFVAKKLAAHLIFYHGVEFLASSEMALGSFSYEDYTSAKIDQSEKQLTELTEKIKAQGCSCESKVTVGDIVDEITGLAEKQGADMIIMGTHGKRGLEKILLGSVAERVLKGAHCPVLVVNPYRHGELV